MTSIERYQDNLPKFVICSDNKRIPPEAERYLPKQYALSKPYLVANNPKYNHYLIFDIDREDSMMLWDIVGIPSPTLVVQNIDNRHSHYLYELGSPLPARSIRTDKTKKLLGVVTDRFQLVLCSDKAIVDQMQLSKNPLCNQWETWGSGDNCGLYSLSELAEYSKPLPQKKLKATGTFADVAESRNCYLFRHGREYAYKIVKDCESENALLNIIGSYLNQLNDNDIRNDINNEFSKEGVLQRSEIKSIAKSISGWVWNNRQNFQLLRSSNKNLGALGLDPMGTGWKFEDSKAEVKNRQSLGAEYSNRIRKEKTQHAIWLGVQQCKEKGLEITTKTVSNQSGVPIRTVQYHIKLLEKFSTEYKCRKSL